MKKKSIGLIVMGLLMFLVLAACGSKSANNSTSQKFHSGVPGVYSGYYGKNGDTKKNFVGMEFQNDQVSVGKLKLNSVQYKQLNSDTYMIKGKTSGSKTAKYLKIGIRVKRNKTYLGIYGDYNKTSDLTDYNKVNNRGKDDVDWFKSYSKEKYDNMTGKTDSENTESTEETDSSNTNDSSSNSKFTESKGSSNESIPASYFEGKIFTEDGNGGAFVSFSAESNSMIYWSMKAGAGLDNASYRVSGNQLVVSGTPNMQGEGSFDNNQDTFKIISKTKLYSPRLHLGLTLFNGSLSDARDNSAAQNDAAMRNATN
ncbi:hypothetical protein [Companilactobacillus sp.]|jgi:hypothetical protein|uniref:hypothetical protein n=1 Tax=Companilactobacillus sp. TaxID=2767905 RepID=UPI0025C50A20|nr:hypothetical protein [Companilactobacillus sp.]MCH4009931.1 hypothetical protein [Companilactobacillus sp.]MCH4052393.1 hypothetical protein [Companilactobacillus sp.]MCH4077873.1 hypothetical protein [Companilactobacillus sp.]MCH4126449.1 hypothetical protein [Companilactobacillus sp.]MCH4132035.1 hypothetical protein [Companilactobacillus sp.]